METITVKIGGTSPLLMNAYPMVTIEGLDKKPPEAQAEAHLYLHPFSGKICVPGVNVQRGLVAAAAFSKGKGRASLAKIAAAAVFVVEPWIDVAPQTWAVDSRPVVIPATRGRIVRHRARFDDWSLAFHLEYDDTLLTPVQLRVCLDDLGKRVGLLDFRPEKRGPMGRFIVTGWAAQ